MIVVPLDAPGVEVEPLLDLQSDHHFNYVYLKDVRVPADNLVGEVNRGWYVNAQTMDYERSGGAHIGSSRRLVDRALRSIREQPDLNLTGIQKQRLAEIVTTNEVAWLLGYRVAWLREQGLFPNHEASMVKLLTARIRQDVPNLMVQVLGLDGLLSTDANDQSWGADYLDSAAATVAQGSSEIQRNVIATRGLGLPRG
jgi:alkylation response protein AidB-like acyl-CoA dehydrogenase